MFCFVFKLIATLFIYLFIYLFIFSCVGSSFHVRAFSSCGKRGPLFIMVRGPLFIAVHRPLTITAPPVAGHRLQKHRLSSCGSQAQLLHGMWDLPRPGLEPVSPALAGRFSTTAPPGKPPEHILTTVTTLHFYSLLHVYCFSIIFYIFYFVYPLTIHCGYNFTTFVF